jgi:hypothetical protein
VTKKAKPPLIDRLYARVMRRWPSDPEGAFVYIRAAAGCLNRGAQIKLIERLPPPLAQRMHDAQAERVRKAREKQEEMRQAREQLEARARATEARRAELLAEKSRLSGIELAAFLAGLSPELRDQIASPAERREAIALRKTAVLAGMARTILGCTATELDRWYADGRLPHLFIRKLRFERGTLCRFWELERVAGAVHQVPAWRTQDAAQKAARRAARKTQG